MIALRRPSRERIDAYLAAQGRLALSYPDAGVTKQGRDGLPPAIAAAYAVDHNRQRLGAGERDFERAVQAVRSWQMFALGWVELCWPDAPIAPGTAVGVLARLRRLWTLSACRIVYTLDERDGAVCRFGFGYGTLPDHGVRGEERFCVEWDRESDAVSYDLLAVSQPASPATRIGRRGLRRLQRRFAADSKRAMRACVSGGA